MANVILEGCKKCVIQRVINPGVYWMTEYESDRSYKKELEKFERFLTQHVKHIKTEQIDLGETVAVKNASKFHRGLVVDVFNKNCKIKFLILLVDYGNIIETNRESIYAIENVDLKIKNLNGFKVSLQGIQPVVLDIDYEKHYLKGIFQKRKCDNWSTSAYKFVENLIKQNPYVYVKVLNTSEERIFGEIYFVQESKGLPMPLSQKLCDEGFATFSYVVPKEINKHASQIDNIEAIEDKIPKNALLKELQNSDAVQTCKDLYGAKKDVVEISNLKYSSGHDVCPYQKILSGVSKIQNESFGLSKANALYQNQHLKSSSKSSESRQQSPSSSWVFKKYKPNNLASSSCDSSKSQETCESKETKSASPENPKVCLFKVVERNLKLYDKQKQMQ